MRVLIFAALLVAGAYAQVNRTTACALTPTCDNVNTICDFGSCITTTAYGQNCNQTAGNALGAECSLSNGINCDSRSAYCESTTNRCTGLIASGQSCAGVSGSVSQRNSACATGLCTSDSCFTLRLPGDSCSNANECRVDLDYKGDMGCNDGQCKTNSLGGNNDVCCLGTGCGTERGCNAGFYCSSTSAGVDGTCTARLQENNACSTRVLDPAQCPGGTVCTNTAAVQATTGTCTRMWSAAAGDNCGGNSDGRGDLVCQDLTTCTSAGKCTTVTNNTACSNTAGCGQDAVCSCSGEQPVCNVAGSTTTCDAEMQSYVACLHDNGCSTPTDAMFNSYHVFASGTCANKCKQKYVDYHCCRGLEWRLSAAGPFECPSTTPTPLPTENVDPVGLGLGVPLFFIALVVSLLVLCEVPQQRSPYLWLSLCWWHMWDHEIDDFIKEHELSMAKTIKYGFSGSEGEGEADKTE